MFAFFFCRCFFKSVKVMSFNFVNSQNMRIYYTGGQKGCELNPIRSTRDICHNQPIYWPSHVSSFKVCHTYMIYYMYAHMSMYVCKLSSKGTKFCLFIPLFFIRFLLSSWCFCVNYMMLFLRKTIILHKK